MSRGYDFFHLFLDLFNNLVNPQLDLFLSLFFSRGLYSFLADFFPPTISPSIPFVHKSFTGGSQFCTDIAFFCCIIFVKGTAEIPKIFSNLLLSLFAEQTNGTWTPNKLFKAILNLLCKFLSTEVPDSETIFKLEFAKSAINYYRRHHSYRVGPGTCTCSKIPSARVPFNICNPVMICGA